MCLTCRQIGPMPMTVHARGGLVHAQRHETPRHPLPHECDLSASPSCLGGHEGARTAARPSAPPLVAGMRGAAAAPYPPMCPQRRAPTGGEGGIFLGRAASPNPRNGIAGRYHYTHLAPTIPLSLPTLAVKYKPKHLHGRKVKV